jgi:hypothetical protein
MSKQDHFLTDQWDNQESYICPNITIQVLTVAYLRWSGLFFSWRNIETNPVCLSEIRVGRILLEQSFLWVSLVFPY